MNHYFALTAVCLLQAAVIAGCATAPPSTPAPDECGALAAAEAAAEDQRQLAEKRKESAWRSVLPFAVVATYAKERQAMDSAERAILELRGRRAELGCAS